MAKLTNIEVIDGFDLGKGFDNGKFLKFYEMLAIAEKENFRGACVSIYKDSEKADNFTAYFVFTNKSYFATNVGGILFGKGEKFFLENYKEYFEAPKKKLIIKKMSDFTRKDLIMICLVFINKYFGSVLRDYAKISDEKEVCFEFCSVGVPNTPTIVILFERGFFTEKEYELLKYLVSSREDVLSEDKMKKINLVSSQEHLDALINDRYEDILKEEKCTVDDSAEKVKNDIEDVDSYVSSFQDQSKLQKIKQKFGFFRNR